MSGGRPHSAAASIERMLANLAGPELVEEPGHEGQPPSSPAGADFRPAVGSDYSAYLPAGGSGQRTGLGADDPYDEDYDYYWGGVRMPLWIALIWQVPWRQRLDIFVVGFIVGLVVAGVAVTWGLLLSRY